MSTLHNAYVEPVYHLCKPCVNLFKNNHNWLAHNQLFPWLAHNRFPHGWKSTTPTVPPAGSQSIVFEAGARSAPPQPQSVWTSMPLALPYRAPRACLGFI